MAYVAEGVRSILEGKSEVLLELSHLEELLLDVRRVKRLEAETGAAGLESRNNSGFLVADETEADCVGVFFHN